MAFEDGNYSDCRKCAHAQLTDRGQEACDYAFCSARQKFIEHESSDEGCVKKCRGKSPSKSKKPK